MLNITYEDMKKTFKENEISRICLGSGKGVNKVKIAMEQALASQNLIGVTRALICFRCSKDMKIDALKASILLLKNTLPKCEILFGIETLEELKDEVQIIIVANGFEG